MCLILYGVVYFIYTTLFFTIFEYLINSLTASDSLKFQFATDGEGNYGYLGADDSFVPFSQNKCGTLTLETTMQMVDCGFVPSVVMYFMINTDSLKYIQNGIYYNQTYIESRVADSGIVQKNNGNLVITDSGFQIKASSSYYEKEIYYIAMK